MVGTSELFYNPVVERTRLRFADMAEQGWLYLTNAPQGNRRAGLRTRELEMYIRYGRPFDAREVRICPNRPAFGTGEMTHVVLPETAPVFVRPGRPEVLAALQADFSAENAAWQATAQAYVRHFARVTAERYSEMVDAGWLWVLDVLLRDSWQDCDDLADRVTHNCMGLRALSPAGVRVCRTMGQQGAGTSVMLPVFVRPRVYPAQAKLPARAAAYALVG